MRPQESTEEYVGLRFGSEAAQGGDEDVNRPNSIPIRFRSRIPIPRWAVGGRIPMFRCGAPGRGKLVDSDTGYSVAPSA